MRIMVVNDKDDNESVPFTSFVVVNKFVTWLVVEVEEDVLLCVREAVGEELGVGEEVRVGEELGVGEEVGVVVVLVEVKVLVVTF